MPEESKQPALEAASPFELRVDLGRHVPESDVRSALATGDMGFVHSFTTGSALDGPGIRVVVWLSGCQFRCLYCHNPDTWNMTNGIPITLERAKEQLSKYRHGLKTMKGGLTISGGEPLMQHKFALKLFGAAKEMGVHTALDSNGFLGSRLSDSDLEKVDLVLLDLKAFDAELHHRLTGQDVAPVHEFGGGSRPRKDQCGSALFWCRDSPTIPMRWPALPDSPPVWGMWNESMFYRFIRWAPSSGSGLNWIINSRVSNLLRRKWLSEPALSSGQQA